MAEPQCLTIKYEPQGGELDAEADVDILKSSETRTEMKLSADQIHQVRV